MTTLQAKNHGMEFVMERVQEIARVPLLLWLGNEKVALIKVDVRLAIETVSRRPPVADFIFVMSWHTVSQPRRKGEVAGHYRKKIRR